MTLMAASPIQLATAMAPPTQQQAADCSNSASTNHATFHRRQLPDECIAFASAAGRRLFVEALNAPIDYMTTYFPLAEQFTTQAEPAYCGLSTLVMCLNALGCRPRTRVEGIMAVVQ
ncbi:hypothetical protein PINS_up005273 [Pythium insidiosum]|nr:hypothetical protein PINS_up005273 [Pythium insidiosum]